MSLKAGDRVYVSAHGQARVEAMVSLASDNGESLMLVFDALFHIPNDGSYVGSMPILRTAEGWIEIIHGTAIQLEVITGEA